jgi:hypothetical protein
LLQDEREQKAEATKLIHILSNNGPKTDDKFWVKARNEILWLRDWGAEDGWSTDAVPRGVFSQVKRDFLELEILKALLSNTRESAGCCPTARADHCRLSIGTVNLRRRSGPAAR